MSALYRNKHKKTYKAVKQDDLSRRILAACLSASFASLGDIILAEPGATVGFAGRRVIEGTIGETLPDDFQSSEFLLEHGFCDRIVPRSRMKEELARLLQLHEGKGGRKR